MSFQSNEFDCIIGYHVLEPESGMLACGYEGSGRLPEIVTVFTKKINDKTNNRSADRMDRWIKKLY